MTAAQMKEHEKKKKGIYKERENKKRTKQDAQKKKKIVLKASIVVTKLPVSATKPNRGLRHTIRHLPALVDNGIKYST